MSHHPSAVYDSAPHPSVRLALWALLAVAAGCVAPTERACTPRPGPPDAGTPDAGNPDTGAPDAGKPDAGTPDVTGSPCTSPQDCVALDTPASSDAGWACVRTACGGAGSCVVPSDPCPQDWQPVCGCDGSTYASACLAERAGAGVAKAGPCAGTPQGCSLSGKACAAGQLCQVTGCGEAGPGLCVDPKAACSSEDVEVCGCDGKVYDDACAAQQASVNVANVGPCPIPDPGGPCGGKQGKQCPTTQSCDLLGCGLDSGGVCIGAVPKVCPEPLPKSDECGCDGKTYPSACHRQQAGVARAGKGPCGGNQGPGESCGGFSGAKCQTGLWCDPASCGSAAGTCAKSGGLCPLPLPGSAVCGCDGKTYAGECERLAAQVGKAKEGACTP